MTDKKFHDFAVTNESPYGYKAEVSLDGQRLLGVKSVTVQISADSGNRITIEFIAASINGQELPDVEDND